MANSSSKVMLAAILGVAAGIGIGILIAPSKGSKTRKRLKKRLMGFADMMQDDLSDKLNAFKSAFSPEEEDALQDDEMYDEQKETV